MRTLAIGDIHGCLASLDTLLNLVRPTTDDLLVTLGDHVDRGPDSRGVLDRMLALHATGRVVSLRGNHEIMMAAARDGKSKARYWYSHGGAEALDSYRELGRHVSLDDIPERHWAFIESTTQLYYETETHIFVHANLHPDTELADQPELYLCWETLDRKQHRPHCSGKTMVCGHTPQKNGRPLVLDHAVIIDTWACGDGWLTCLDAGTGHYWQADELGRTREGDLE